MLTDQTMIDFYQALCPWGYLDIERTITILTEAEISLATYAAGIDEWLDAGTIISNVDCVWRAYIEIIREAAIKTNYLEDLMDNIHPNFIATYINLDSKVIQANLNLISESERNVAWHWLSKNYGVCE